MQIKDVRPQSFVSQVRCDRCARLADVSEAEFQEFVSIDMQAGYASIFGDGCKVQIDLCQHCLRAALGPWLRVMDPGADSLQLQERLLEYERNLTGHGLTGRANNSQRRSQVWNHASSAVEDPSGSPSRAPEHEAVAAVGANVPDQAALLLRLRSEPAFAATMVKASLPWPMAESLSWSEE